MKLFSSCVGSLAFALVLALGTVGCGDDGGGGSGGKGGASAKGSSSAKGGSGGSQSGTGGNTGSGGKSSSPASSGGSSSPASSAVGGSSTSGGSTASGGAASGGNSGTGTGGSAAGGGSGTAGGTTGTGGTTGVGGNTGTGGFDGGVSDANIDAPTTDGNVSVQDALASEAGPDTASDSASEVGLDAAIDSPVDAPFGEVGDALGLDGEAGNCYLAIKNNGYAAGAATPCGTCLENTLSRATECKTIVDCLAAAGMSCVGNCYTDCFNQGGGGSVTATCVTNLIEAACP